MIYCPVVHHESYRHFFVITLQDRAKLQTPNRIPKILIDEIHLAYLCSFFSYIAILILKFLVDYGWNVSWKFYLEKLSFFFKLATMRKSTEKKKKILHWFLLVPEYFWSYFITISQGWYLVFPLLIYYKLCLKNYWKGLKNQSCINKINEIEGKPQSGNGRRKQMY